jgi:uncharacterized protein YndB with AHSA1/START domain
MGMVTSASIDLAATPADVFRWLIEPKRLTQWLGASGAMPTDSSVLKAGFTAQSTMDAPGGAKWPTSLMIDEYSPPTSYSFTLTYPGGTAKTTYSLAATPTGTRLSVNADTDYASADNSKVDTAAAHESFLMRAYIHLAVAVVEHKLAKGELTGANESTQGAMQKGLEESLTKLKSLVEGAS